VGDGGGGGARARARSRRRRRRAGGGDAARGDVADEGAGTRRRDALPSVSLNGHFLFSISQSTASSDRSAAVGFSGDAQTLTPMGDLHAGHASVTRSGSPVLVIAALFETLAVWK